jgi:PhzF family phenazine biosynthesis protein
VNPQHPQGSFIDTRGKCYIFCSLAGELLMTIPLMQVDAFTDRPFAGNPAAVCFLDGPRPGAWQQQVASEMNLSETAFLYADGDKFNLRWFTPKVEVDLCGHATLASAHALWEMGKAPRGEPIRFQSRSGLLVASTRGELIELDFPAKRPMQAAAPPGLLDALGISAVYIGRNQFDYLVVTDSEASVRSVRPDFSRLAGVDARGIIVSGQSTGKDYDFVSRFFAPASGVNEDPVTGSAHCCLAPYWQEKLGKDEMIAYQASPRGGVIRVRVAGDRVFLGGKAVTVLRGELTC